MYRYVLLCTLLGLAAACGSDPVGDASVFDAGADTAADTAIDAPRDTAPDTTVDSTPPPRCGDSAVTEGETCDDGNGTSGDGCDSGCAIEEGYTCPPEGGACTEDDVCGNARMTGAEACDDGNESAGDGCDASCQLEAGWICPMLGRRCAAAACGDGIVAGEEECEDGGDPPSGGDGCSASCFLEGGFACDPPGAGCRPTTCGDGNREGTEQCDDGNRDSGDGCGPFCEVEPVCADGVCTTACGDGVVLPGEPCDDGNTRSGDGCSETCELEEGFSCELMELEDPAELLLPIVLRDFQGNDVGGHPDFQSALGSDRGIVQTDLGTDGLPVYASATDTPTTNGREAFDQWYRDSDQSLTVVSRIRLPRTGAGAYEFDDSSFFPLDGPCPSSDPENLCGLTGMGTEAPRFEGHNFHFTSIVRYWFEYEGDEVLDFRGDDDVWVFINGKLAIDLGGVHAAEAGSVTLDAAAAATLGLDVGGIYEAVVFQAERHETGSNYRLTLSNFTASRTECSAECGDGIVSRVEECDAEPYDGSYGGCNPDCTRGPHCGDGVRQSAEGEECDDGNDIDSDGCSNMCETTIE